MKKGHSKSKGSGFEREIAKMLSLFWSDQKHKDLCWRSTSSGARGTVQRTATKAYHGDLASTSPLMDNFFETFCLELKFYKDVDISEVLRGCKSKILTWWTQCKKSAVLSHRIPILIYKSNNRPIYLVCDHRALCMGRSFIAKPWAMPMVSLGNKLHILPFEEVLKQLDITQVKDFVNGSLTIIKD